MSELLKLRRRLEEARKTGRRRLPLALRIEIGGAALRLRDEQGLSRQRLAAQLGMSKATLNSWVDLARAKSSSADVSLEKTKQAGTRILPVEIETELEPPHVKAPSVRLPSGTIVVGLSITDIAALERALS